MSRFSSQELLKVLYFLLISSVIWSVKVLRFSNVNTKNGSQKLREGPILILFSSESYFILKLKKNISRLKKTIDVPWIKLDQNRKLSLLLRHYNFINFYQKLLVWLYQGVYKGHESHANGINFKIGHEKHENVMNFTFWSWLLFCILTYKK